VLDLLVALFKKYSAHLTNADVAEQWVLPAWWKVFETPWAIPDLPGRI
jgi:hypothetical protein